MAVSAASLRALLRAHADPVNAAGARRYFVDGVKTYGVHRTLLDGFARDAVAALAARILERFSRHLTPAHFGTPDRWVGFLNDWASCDSLCCQLIGPLVHDHPALIRRLAPWTRSRHRWRRRAAAVSLIPLARIGERLPEILAVAAEGGEEEGRRGGDLPGGKP